MRERRWLAPVGSDPAARDGGGVGGTFVAGLGCWAWLDREAGVGPAAFLLLAHPEAERVHRELCGLAAALRLAAGPGRIPRVGARVAIVGGDRAALRLDGSRSPLEVEVGGGWAEMVLTGWPVALAVGWEPLERRAPLGTVEGYLARCAMAGRLALGLATSLGSFTAEESGPAGLLPRPRGGADGDGVPGAGVSGARVSEVGVSEVGVSGAGEDGYFGIPGGAAGGPVAERSGGSARLGWAAPVARRNAEADGRTARSTDRAPGQEGSRLVMGGLADGGGTGRGRRGHGGGVARGCAMNGPNGTPDGAGPGTPARRTRRTPGADGGGMTPMDLRGLRPDQSEGDLLDRPAYLRDFWGRRGVYRRDSWRVERRQHVEEPDDASRAALRRGDWDESIRLLEDGRPELLTYSAHDLRLGVTFHRVRVVEEPFTPYVQWELNALRVQAECGRKARVVSADLLREAERGEPLPDMVVLGGRTLYEIVYTEAGVPCGAVRYSDPELVERWVRFAQGLYVAGEDVLHYVERRVAGLAPPRL